MQTFEVWLEGAWVPVQRNCGHYKDGELAGQPIPCFGSCAPAEFLGKVEAHGFVDACWRATKAEFEPDAFDAAEMKFRGRRMFDNETAARRHFG